MTRDSSESLASTKSSFINSGNRKGGNSWYFQTGSVVRPLHIAKSPSFRISELTFTESSLVPALADKVIRAVDSPTKSQCQLVIKHDGFAGLSHDTISSKPRASDGPLD